MKAASFPGTLFVHREPVGESDVAYAADERVEQIDAEHDGREIAIYELVRVVTLRVERKLEPR